MRINEDLYCMKATKTIRTSILSFYNYNYLFNVVARKVKCRFRIKGTVSVTSSDPPCKDGNAQFTTVPLKYCLIRYDKDFNVNNLENWLFLNVVSLQKILTPFYCRKKIRELSELNAFKPRQYLAQYYSDIRCQG